MDFREIEKGFEGKTLLITGGTGSFGNAVLKRFIRTGIAEIRVFSRDEKKQDDMRHLLQETYPESASKVKFYIGDVREPGSVKNAVRGVDYIFHAAALKQVPSCEFFPIEAVKTNVLGTENVLQAAIDAEFLVKNRKPISDRQREILIEDSKRYEGGIEEFAKIADAFLS